MQGWTRTAAVAVTAVVVGLVVLGSPARAVAGDSGKVSAVGALLDLLIDKGVITRDEAAGLAERYGEQARVAPVVTPPPPARGWSAPGVQWSGDVRLRYQGDRFDDHNAILLRPDDPGVLMNTTVDRQRGRYRVRLGLRGEVNESVEFGARLTTGNEKDPVSTNDTLGDYNRADAVVFDRAYLRWTPLPGVELTGGRMPNPWFHSDLVWDPDLNFEGVAVKAGHALLGGVSGFVTAGAFPLQEVALSGADKWLFGGQVGVEVAATERVKLQLGVAYYDYTHVTGRPNNPARPNERDFTAPLFQQKGNTLFDIDPTVGVKTALASDFNELNITGAVELGFFDPVYVTILGDYVKNLGFDAGDVAGRTGGDVAEKTTGYKVALAVGHRKTWTPGEWRFSLAYKHLEADAVIDGFTDSDFHLGGTNAEGWILAGQIGVAKNVWLRTRWLSADEIDGPPLAIDVLQVDLNARF